VPPVGRDASLGRRRTPGDDRETLAQASSRYRQRGRRETVPKQPHRIVPSAAEADAATTGGSSQRRRELVRPGGAEVAEKDLDLVVERGDGSVRRLDDRVREDVVP
jgi:hypothetical protein